MKRPGGSTGACPHGSGRHPVQLEPDLVEVYKRPGLDIVEYNGPGRNVLPVPGTFVIDRDGVVRASSPISITRNVWNPRRFSMHSRNSGIELTGKRSAVRGSGPIRALLRWVLVLAAMVAGGWYMIRMPGTSWSGPLPPLSGEERQLRDRLRQHVVELARHIGERNVWHPEALAAAAGYIGESLRGSAYTVTAQPFASRGRTVENLEAELPGRQPANGILVVGAHYDSVAGTPGGNDNASGVAALLEIARLLAGSDLSHSVRFVAFANEEPPFFYSEEMGSHIYASRARERGERIEAMLALETIGYYSNAPDSQRYPFPFGFFYPDTGNFIGFVGNLTSRSLVRRAIGAFRASTRFPSEGVAAPGWMAGIHWSDHWSFWQAGYPAIMVTDTALFRYPYYHSAGDTPDRLDYAALARVTRGLVEVIASLAGRQEARDRL